MAEHNNLGRKGEDIAVEYMQEQGYKILARNWQYDHKELDLIACNERFLVVTEIKTRSTEAWEHPKEAITPGKIRNIITATEAYILQNNIELEIRFDVISVIPIGETFKIDHIDDAFISPVN